MDALVCFSQTSGFCLFACLLVVSITSHESDEIHKMILLYIGTGEPAFLSDLEIVCFGFCYTCPRSTNVYLEYDLLYSATMLHVLDGQSQEPVGKVETL